MDQPNDDDAQHGNCGFAKPVYRDQVEYDRDQGHGEGHSPRPTAAGTERGQMNLTVKQIATKEKIQRMAETMGVDPIWAISIAMAESSLGEYQKSPTGCKGVFQMSSIAMRDLHQEMAKGDDDWADIACGVAFLRLLFLRHKTIMEATEKFCDPKDRWFYVSRVINYMEAFNELRSFNH